MTQITTMVWSLTESQTHWNAIQWTLWSITASGGDEIQLSYFKYLRWCCESAALNIYKFGKFSIGSVQSLSRVRLFVTPWITALQASLSITNSQSLLKLMSIEMVMTSSHLILCHPLLFLPSVFPSIRVFSNGSALRMRWPKHWSFSFSIIPAKEIPGLISFRMDWLDLLAVQGTLKSLLQHHSSKESVLWHSVFFKKKERQESSLSTGVLWVKALWGLRRCPCKPGSSSHQAQICLHLIWDFQPPDCDESVSAI